MKLRFEHTYATLPARFYARVEPVKVTDPQVVIFNRALAGELRMDPDMDARQAAEGHEAVLVSHQLPIWITRLRAEGRSFLHDPRRRQCTLCSLTSFTFDGERLVSVGYSEPAGDLIPLADRSAPFSAGGADDEHKPPS